MGKKLFDDKNAPTPPAAEQDPQGGGPSDPAAAPETPASPSAQAPAVDPSTPTPAAPSPANNIAQERLSPMPPSSGKVEPAETRTTPAGVPPASFIPDQAPEKVLPKDTPARELAEPWAKRLGYFYTTDMEQVRALTKMGIQPLHCEGPRPTRQTDLYVYQMTPEKAKELLNG